MCREVAHNTKHNRANYGGIALEDLGQERGGEGLKVEREVKGHFRVCRWPHTRDGPCGVVADVYS